MSEKHPSWTRTKLGKTRVHWVAYDDRLGNEGCSIIDQGYATSLPEADAAARAALANAGMYQGRRMSSSAFHRPAPAKTDEVGSSQPKKPARPEPYRRREYVYSRSLDGEDGTYYVVAHVILKKTAKRVYITQSSCGPDQLGTVDERWDEQEPKIALDRLRLERDGSVYSKNNRHSAFYHSRDEAVGDTLQAGRDAFRVLEIQTPCTLEDIKAAYRRKALAVHPDRGGSPAEFQAVEAAYRHLIRQAQSTK